MKWIKKLGIAMVSNVIAILALILNILQFGINLIINLGTIASTVIQTGFWFMGIVVGVVPLFTADGSFLHKLLEAILSMGLMMAVSGVMCWLMDKISFLLSVTLGWVHFDRLIARFQNCMPRLFVAYMGLDGDAPLSPIDRYLLFGIFMILDKLLTILLLTLYAVRKWLYPVCGIAGAAFFGYQIFKDGVADWGATEYVTVAIVFCAIMVALLSVVKYFVEWLERIQSSSSVGLDETYRVYSRLFRNSESTNHEQKASQDSTEHGHVYYADASNPYIIILSQANTLDELRKKYRRLAAELHPDVAGEQSTERQQMLNDAYELAKAKFK